MSAMLHAKVRRVHAWDVVVGSRPSRDQRAPDARICGRELEDIAEFMGVAGNEDAAENSRVWQKIGECSRKLEECSSELT